MAKATTRGIRNNNPGNIRVGDPWQGIMPKKDRNAGQLAEKEFVVFSSPKWGIRALARVLISYQDKHGLETIEGIISRWAPPVENDTKAYIRAVARSSGFSETQVLNMHDFAHVKPIVKAIIKHENGVQPYDDNMINTGLALAGVLPKSPKTVAGTGTGKASAVATVGTVTTVVAVATQAKDAVVQARTIWDDLWMASPYIAAGFVLVGIGYIVYSKWDHIRKGLS